VAATRVNRTLVALAGIVAAGAALRFATLDLQSFWVDEGATVHLLRGDFGDLVDGIPVTEKTPPLYYVLAWLWTQVFGTGEVGVRSLSALAGVLTIPVAFALARELASERAGLVAALLTAVNPLLVWYSQEARAYALLVLLAALATLYGVRAAGGGKSATRGQAPCCTRSLWLWAVASALALATHYFAIFAIAPLAAWILMRRADRGRALMATGVIALAGLALLPLAADQSENPGANFIRGTSLVTRIAQVPKQFLLGFDAPAEVAFTIAALGLAAAALALALARGDSGPRIALALGAAAVALPVVAALFGADFVLSRNLIVALVPLAVVVAAGTATRGAAGLALAGALAALSLATVLTVFARPEFQRDDWRGAAEAIGPAETERALVVNPIAGATPLRLYLDGLEPYGEEFRQVSGIVLIGVTTRRPGETPRPPEATRPTIAGFSVVGQRETETYTLVFLKADAGQHGIASAGLTSIKLEPSPGDLAVTLLQRPVR
jgi:mannosyltransferase